MAGGVRFLSVVQQVDADHYTDMWKFPTALGTRTGVWYEKRDRLYIAAPPSGTLGARLFVFEVQTEWRAAPAWTRPTHETTCSS